MVNNGANVRKVTDFSVFFVKNMLKDGGLLSVELLQVCHYFFR